jgi:hypothetical protein
VFDLVIRRTYGAQELASLQENLPWALTAQLILMELRLGVVVRRYYMRG